MDTITAILRDNGTLPLLYVTLSSISLLSILFSILPPLSPVKSTQSLYLLNFRGLLAQQRLRALAYFCTPSRLTLRFHPFLCSKTGPSKDRWNGIIDGFHTHRMPWLTLEAVFYRLLMDECDYFATHNDPFRPQKLQSLVDAESVINHISSARDQYDLSNTEALVNLLHVSLWSNAADLSRHPQGIDSTLADTVFSTMPDTKRSHILINHCSAIIDLIQSLPPIKDSSSQTTPKVIILCDNAGIEFLSDLLWADLLISSQRIQRVEFHVKFHPTFVSDITKYDVEDTLVFVEKVAPDLGRCWREYFADGKFVLLEHPYYNTYEPFWVIPLDLYNSYQQAAFVVSKGDANARRFHGDRAWAFSTPTEQIVSYFPVPLLLIRTFKSETVSGVSADIIHELAKAMKSDWYHSGEYGTIQLIRPRNFMASTLSPSAKLTLSPPPFSVKPTSEEHIHIHHGEHHTKHHHSHQPKEPSLPPFSALLDQDYDEDPLELEVREMLHDEDHDGHLEHKRNQRRSSSPPATSHALESESYPHSHHHHHHHSHHHHHH